MLKIFKNKLLAFKTADKRDIGKVIDGPKSSKHKDKEPSYGVMYENGALRPNEDMHRIVRSLLENFNFAHYQDGVSSSSFLLQILTNFSGYHSEVPASCF